MSELLRYTNISIGGCSVIFCITAIFVLLVGTKINTKTRNYFFMLFSCLCAALCSNILGLIFKGSPTHTGNIIIHISNFCEFFFSFLLSFIFMLCILNAIKNNSQKKLKVCYIIALSLFICAAALIIITQFTNLLYSIDENSMYHRGEFYWLTSALGVISLVTDTVIMIIYRKELRKKELYSFATFIALSVIANVISAFIYGIYFNLIAETLSAIIMMILVVHDQLDLFCVKEQENLDMQSAIMLSQIQPHFLHNSLVSIAQLCEKNPRQAKEATIAFSEYLRENMNSLKQKTPVPFERELEHLQTYVMLEKIRFGDMLNVEYNIQTVDFYVPVLSIQPLVENAIKHGVSPKREGGTVKVSTYDFHDRVEIKISDDGIGCNFSLVLNDGKNHVGIKNAKSRLKNLCGAEIIIDSQSDIGTDVTIIIPKA